MSLSNLKLPVRRVVADAVPEQPLDPKVWPATVPAVAQLLREQGLELGAITVLVGENGSGKSTLVEAIAQAYGLNSEGGTPNGRHETRASESVLYQSIRLERGLGASKWGFFLRAETMHGLYTYLEEIGSNPHDPDPVFHELSHGESFLAMVSRRFSGAGFYVLDEPESALSFNGCLALIDTLLRVTKNGKAQALIATHSPVVAAIPGARILQLDADGYHETTWEDLALVDHYRRFLAEPQRYLRHLKD